MKISFKVILCIIAAMLTKQLLADNLITFFMLPFPYVPTNKVETTREYAETKSKKLQHPGKIAKYTLRSILESNTASGIFCTYKGQLAISDSNGEVMFARRQESPDMTLVITPRINPFLEHKQVVHHWELEIGVPARMYSVTRHEDPDTAIAYWDVKKIEHIKVNETIPLNAVVVFAKPDYIFVPEGITETDKGPQLVLPDLYVKKNVDKLETALYVLNLKRFFMHTNRIYKVKPGEYNMLLY